MSEKTKRTKLKQILLAFAFFGLGYVFSWTGALWIHEGGHVLGALLTGSEINGISLIPPWEGHVDATYHSVFAGNVIFLGGFFVTFVPFLCVFAMSLIKKSAVAYFMVFPLFMTFPSSWGDLKFIGFDITTFGAFIMGWFVPFIVFATIVGYYNIYLSKPK